MALPVPGGLAKSRHQRCGSKTDRLTRAFISQAFVTGATVQPSSWAKMCRRNFSHPAVEIFNSNEFKIRYVTVLDVEEPLRAQVWSSTLVS